MTNHGGKLVNVHHDRIDGPYLLFTQKEKLGAYVNINKILTITDSYAEHQALRKTKQNKKRIASENFQAERI